LSLVTSSYLLAAHPQPALTQRSFLYPSGDAGVAQRQSSCFVNRWSVSGSNRSCFMIDGTTQVALIE
jgi:hypothetical protein